MATEGAGFQVTGVSDLDRPTVRAIQDSVELGGPVSGGRGPSRDQRFAVISRRVVFVVGSALLVGGVLAILNDQVVLGIALAVVAFLAVVWRGLMTLRRRQRALADQARAQVPDGAVMIKPADAKVPVSTVLRNNGWRPRFDWFGARLFEK